MGLVKKLSVGGELVVTPIVGTVWVCIKGSRRAAKCLNIVTILKLYSKILQMFEKRQVEVNALFQINQFKE